MPTKKKQSVWKSPKQRFEVLLEDIHSEVKVIAEQSSAHTEGLDSMGERLTTMDGRLDKIEANIAVTKLDIEFIKHELKQKVARDEFAVLERRVALLENKRHAMA